MDRLSMWEMNEGSKYGSNLSQLYVVGFFINHKKTLLFVKKWAVH